MSKSGFVLFLPTPGSEMGSDNRNNLELKLNGYQVAEWSFLLSTILSLKGLSPTSLLCCFPLLPLLFFGVFALRDFAFDFAEHALGFGLLFLHAALTFGARFALGTGLLLGVAPSVSGNPCSCRLMSLISAAAWSA